MFMRRLLALLFCFCTLFCAGSSALAVNDISEIIGKDDMWDDFESITLPPPAGGDRPMFQAAPAAESSAEPSASPEPSVASPSYHLDYKIYNKGGSFSQVFSFDGFLSGDSFSYTADPFDSIIVPRGSTYYGFSDTSYIDYPLSIVPCSTVGLSSFSLYGLVQVCSVFPTIKFPPFNNSSNRLEALPSGFQLVINGVPVGDIVPTDFDFYDALITSGTVSIDYDYAFFYPVDLTASVSDFDYIGTVSLRVYIKSASGHTTHTANSSIDSFSASGKLYSNFSRCMFSFIPLDYPFSDPTVSMGGNVRLGIDSYSFPDSNDFSVLPFTSSLHHIGSFVDDSGNPLSSSYKFRVTTNVDNEYAFYDISWPVSYSADDFKSVTLSGNFFYEFRFMVYMVYKSKGNLVSYDLTEWSIPYRYGVGTSSCYYCLLVNGSPVGDRKSIGSNNYIFPLNLSVDLSSVGSISSIGLRFFVSSGDISERCGTGSDADTPQIDFSALPVVRTSSIGLNLSAVAADPPAPTPEPTPEPPPDYTGILETISGGIGDAIQAVKDVGQGIIELPGKIISGLLEGLKSLFVPDADAIQELKTKYQTLLESKFGFIYQSFVLIGQLFDTVVNGWADHSDYVFEFPGVVLPLNGEEYTLIPAQTVSLNNALMDTLRAAAGTIVCVICVASMIHAFEMMFIAIVSGKNYFDYLNMVKTAEEEVALSQ